MIVFLGPCKWVTTVICRGVIYDYGPGPPDEHGVPGWIWWWTAAGESMSMAIMEEVFTPKTVAVVP